MKTKAISLIAGATLATAFALPGAASAAPTLGSVTPAEIGAQTSSVTNVGYYDRYGCYHANYGRVYCSRYSRRAPRVYHTRRVYRYRTYTRCRPVYRTRVRTVYGFGRIYKQRTTYRAGTSCRTYRVRY